MTRAAEEAGAHVGGGPWWSVLLAASRDAVLLTDASGVTTEANLAAVRLFGRHREDLVGRLPGQVVSMAAGGEARMLAALTAGRSWSGEVSFVRPDGSAGVCETSVDPVFDNGRFAGSVGICRDVTEQRRLGAALAEAEQRWRLSLDHAPVGMALVGLDGRFLRVNAALCRLVGYSEPELVTRTFQDITHPEDLDADLALLGRLVAGEITDYELEKRYLHAAGRQVWIQLAVGLVRDEAGAPLHFVVHVSDVTERRARTARLERQASRDPLTGLANRTAFTDCLQQAIRQPGGFGVGYLDLDGFKAVNDAYGHAAGDELLRQAADRLSRGLRPGDVAARLGGDEFAVLLDDVGSAEHLAAIGKRLLAALRGPFRIDTDALGPVQLTAGISIGLTLARPGHTAPELLARADAAMYRAKAAGTNRCELG